MNKENKQRKEDPWNIDRVDNLDMAFYHQPCRVGPLQTFEHKIRTDLLNTYRHWIKPNGYLLLCY